MKLNFVMWQEDWVLCRVFHKSKGENCTELSPPIMFETSTHAPSLTDQTSMPCGGYQQISSLSTTPTHQSHGQSLLNLLQYSQEKNNNNNCSYEVSSKVDDDYDFLWDMNIEENSLGDHHIHGVGSDLEDMRFEIDNSMVFLWKILYTLEREKKLPFVDLWCWCGVCLWLYKCYIGC